MSNTTDDEASADTAQVSALLAAAERGEPHDRPTEALFSAPQSEYTRALLAAAFADPGRAA